MNKKTKRKLFINISILVVMLGVIIFLVKNSLADILQELLHTSGWILLGVTLLGVAYQWLEGMAIKSLVNLVSEDFTTKDGFFFSCNASFYRMITFGTGTLIAELAYSRKKDLTISHSLGMVILRMLMYKAAVVTMALFGLLINFQYFQQAFPRFVYFIAFGIIINIGIIAVVLIFTLNIKVQIAFVALSHKLCKREKVRGWLDQANLQIYSLRDMVRFATKQPMMLVKLYLLNVIKINVWYTIPYFVLVQTHPDIAYITTLALIASTVILASVLPTPAGIGSFEFVYLILFTELVGTIDAASSMLLYRFATYMLPFIIGGLYVFFEKRKVIQQEIQQVRKEKNEGRNS